MNALAHGVDLVQISRVERVWQAHEARFLERVYTPAEQRYCLDSKHPAVKLAGRFAVKEAVLKALGMGWRGGLEWTHIESLPDGYGRPHLTLCGACADLAAEQGLERWLVSISHSGGYAVASVVGTG